MADRAAVGLANLEAAKGSALAKLYEDACRFPRAAVFSDSSKAVKLLGCTYIHFCNIIYSEKSVRKTDQVCFIFCIDSHEIS